MSYFILDILLLFPLLAASFPISPANEMYEVDKILIEFVQDPNSFDQFCKNEGYDKECLNLKTQMETPLGLMYLLRLKWKCDEIGEKFDNEQKEGCETYREYLDILYNYLAQVHAKTLAEKPNFYLDKIYAHSTLTEMMKSLAIIWQFYFDSEFAESKGHKLERLFIQNYEPKLFNAGKLKYQENWKQPEEFDKFLTEMLTERVKNEFGSSNESAQSAKMENIFDKYNISLPDPDSTYLLKDMTLIAFVRGPSHFDEICTELENESISYRELKVENKEELAEKYQSQLSLLYLMKLNWNCTKIVKQREAEEYVRSECEKFGKYLDILYEYLYQISAKTEAAAVLTEHGPAIKPLFQRYKTIRFFETNFPLSNIIYKLNVLSANFFDVEKYGDYISKSFIGFGQIAYIPSEYTDPSYAYALHLQNANTLVDYKADFGSSNETMRQTFDTKLKTMLKERRKEEKMYRKYNEVWASPFYDTAKWMEDYVLIIFLKDEAKLKQYCEDREEKLLPIFKGIFTDNKTEFLTQKLEAHLGVVYLMRKHWHCDKVNDKFEQKEQTKCQEYRKCLDILSKYLFEVGAEEDEDPVKAVNSQLLIRKVEQFGTLIDAVRVLNRLSSFFFNSKFRQNHKLENVLENWKINTMQNAISIQKFEQMFASVTEHEAIEAQMFKDETFDKKLEEMFNRAEENERKETEKLDPKKRKAKKEEPIADEKIEMKKIKAEKQEPIGKKKKRKEMKKIKRAKAKSLKEEKMKRAAFDDKFGTLLASPFYSHYKPAVTIGALNRADP